MYRRSQSADDAVELRSGNQYNSLSEGDRTSYNTFNRRQNLTYRRTISLHRNAVQFSSLNVILPSGRNAGFSSLIETDLHLTDSSSEIDVGAPLLEQHACHIANEMEQNAALMQNNPVSAQLRKETLRDMPQCLTVRRSIKSHLSKTISEKSKIRTIGFVKRTKYFASMAISKLKYTIEDLIYTFELWYSSLRAIEGRYGSGVATYFRFLRWIFLMDVLIFIPVVGFIIIPQLLFDLKESESNSIEFNKSANGNETYAATSVESIYFDSAIGNITEHVNKFPILDVFTGEGSLTNTVLYYGFYTNSTININTWRSYSIPYAYFLTMLCLYLTVFVVLSVKMARSYRKSFIETAGGLKTIYANKIFCGWDFGIATNDAAKLKSVCVFKELKELLNEKNYRHQNYTIKQRCVTFMVQTSMNALILVLLAGTGFGIWLLLDSHKNNQTAPLISALSITAIMTAYPLLFSYLVWYENYKNPRTALKVTLLRTFSLEVVVVAVLTSFWLKPSNRSNTECWQTSLGQEVYRLIVMDFLVSICFALLIGFVRKYIYFKVWKGIGIPEFNIALNTLNLIYNQTLFWVGFYFSPMLAAIVIIKLLIMFYARRCSVMRLCRPSIHSWRAAQTHTMFLVLSFISLLAVVITYGYLIIHIDVSNCGPFQNYNYTYQVILQGIFQLEKTHVVWKFIDFLTKPGVMAGVLIAMSVGAYYLRAKSRAQIGMVKILRDMLILEAKDKEFLLSCISKVTEGQWLYNLENKTNNRPARTDSPDNDNASIRNSSGFSNSTMYRGSRRRTSIPYESTLAKVISLEAVVGCDGEQYTNKESPEKL